MLTRRNPKFLNWLKRTLGTFTIWRFLSQSIFGTRSGNHADAQLTSLFEQGCFQTSKRRARWWLPIFCLSHLWGLILFGCLSNLATIVPL
jgi:hypothetical protein